MSVQDWPVSMQPRAKMLSQGANNLTDAELIAICLRTGTAGCNAVELAQQLLDQFGNLRQLMDAEHKQVCQLRGLGTTKFLQLQASLELSKRYLRQGIQRDSAFTNTQDTLQFLARQLRHKPHEVFACLFLDNRHRLICYEELFQGGIHSTHIHPRVVVQRALHHNAAAIIFAHNHPSGVADPSHADKQLTGLLQKALELVEIRVLDHIIVGDTENTSLSEQGFM